MLKQKLKYSLTLVFLMSLTFSLVIGFQVLGVELEPCPPPGQGSCGTGFCQVGTGAKARCVIQNPAPNQLVNFRDFGDLLVLIIKWFLYFAGSVAVIFLMVGGFQYLGSRGNEEAMEKAKKTLTSAVIGMIVIVMAFAIVAIINNLLTTAPPRGETGGSEGGGGGNGGAKEIVEKAPSEGPVQGPINLTILGLQSSYERGRDLDIDFTTSPSGCCELSLAGEIPRGLTFNAQRGTLGGVVSVAARFGAYPLTLTARRGNQTVTRQFTILIVQRGIPNP